MGKINGWKNNLKKPSTARVIEHVPLGFSMFTISSFKGIENKHDIYRVKSFMKKFKWIFKKTRSGYN